MNDLPFEDREVYISVVNPVPEEAGSDTTFYTHPEIEWMLKELPGRSLNGLHYEVIPGTSEPAPPMGMVIDAYQDPKSKRVFAAWVLERTPAGQLAEDMIKKFKWGDVSLGYSVIFGPPDEVGFRKVVGHKVRELSITPQGDRDGTQIKRVMTIKEFYNLSGKTAKRDSKSGTLQAPGKSMTPALTRYLRNGDSFHNIVDKLKTQSVAYTKQRSEVDALNNLFRGKRVGASSTLVFPPLQSAKMSLGYNPNAAAAAAARNPAFDDLNIPSRASMQQMSSAALSLERDLYDKNKKDARTTLPYMGGLGGDRPPEYADDMEKGQNGGVFSNDALLDGIKRQIAQAVPQDMAVPVGASDPAMASASLPVPAIDASQIANLEQTVQNIKERIAATSSELLKRQQGASGSADAAPVEFNVQQHAGNFLPAANTKEIDVQIADATARGDTATVENLQKIRAQIISSHESLLATLKKQAAESRAQIQAAGAVLFPALLKDAGEKGAQLREVLPLAAEMAAAAAENPDMNGPAAFARVVEAGASMKANFDKAQVESARQLETAYKEQLNLANQLKKLNEEHAAMAQKLAQYSAATPAFSRPEERFSQTPSRSYAQVPVGASAGAVQAQSTQIPAVAYLSTSTDLAGKYERMVFAKAEKTHPPLLAVHIAKTHGALVAPGFSSDIDNARNRDVYSMEHLLAAQKKRRIGYA